MGRKALNPRIAAEVTLGRSGPARVQGRFARLAGAFELREDIPTAGAYPLRRAIEEVVAEWAAQAAGGGVSPGTVNVHTAVLRQFGKYASAQGCLEVRDVTASLVAEWMRAPSSKSGEDVTTNMVAQRRAVLRACYTTFALLGITDQDVTSATPSIRHTPRVFAPLSEEEVQSLKDFADHDADADAGSTAGPAALALALLGCASKEIPAIRVKDVNLLEGHLWAHSGGDRVRDRYLPIDDAWAFQALAHRIGYLQKMDADAAAGMPLVYRRGKSRGGKSPHNPAAATSNTIDRIFQAAGVKQAGRNRIGSLTERLAVRVYQQTGRFEAVAARLGMSSLDAVAHMLGVDWASEWAATPLAEHP